jgi:hypothetical protein
MKALAAPTVLMALTLIAIIGAVASCDADFCGGSPADCFCLACVKTCASAGVKSCVSRDSSGCGHSEPSTCECAR